jgi:hypothetical protein
LWLLHHLASGTFLKTLGVSECVECVVGGGTARTDAGQHHNFYFFAGRKGISKHHCKFARAEGHMLPLTLLAFRAVNSTHTFFKPKQTFVYFGSFNLAIFVVSFAVGCSF